VDEDLLYWLLVTDCDFDSQTVVREAEQAVLFFDRSSKSIEHCLYSLYKVDWLTSIDIQLRSYSSTFNPSIYTTGSTTVS